jgi:SAM-dependent methyltransferase
MMETPAGTEDNLAGEEVYQSEEGAELYTENEPSGLFVHEEAAIERYLSPDAGPVLDLGCGSGRATGILRERGYDAVGVDLSEPLTGRASARHERVPFAVGTATDLPFPDATFRAVLFAFNGLDYVQSEQERLDALAEIRRVLTADGRFVFSSHNPVSLFPPDPTDLAGYRRKLGFWFANARRGSLFHRYKIDFSEMGAVRTYHISVLGQKRQLRRRGFEVIDVLGRAWGVLDYLDPWPYYVAELD